MIEKELLHSALIAVNEDNLVKIIPMVFKLLTNCEIEKRLCPPFAAAHLACFCNFRYACHMLLKMNYFSSELAGQGSITVTTKSRPKVGKYTALRELL